MAELSVVLKSTEVKQNLLQEYRPDNWAAFEGEVLAFLRQQLHAIGIQSLRMDIAQTAHPGPLLLKFTVISQTQLTAAQLKAVLRR